MEIRRRIRLSRAGTWGVVVCSIVVTFVAFIVVFADYMPVSRRNERRVAMLLQAQKSAVIDQTLTIRDNRLGTIILKSGVPQSIAGYALELRVTKASYVIDAVPLKYPKTGVEYFFLDEDGRIHHEFAEKASAASPYL
jgi:Mg2+/Co2+ transporter CorB